MGNAESAEDIEGTEVRSEIMRCVSTDGSCEHVNRAISILLSERIVPSRSLINKSLCICYYCKPLSRNIFPRGDKKDLIPSRCVKIALNFVIKDAKESSQTIINTYRRVYHGSDPITISNVLSTRRFFPKHTKFFSSSSNKTTSQNQSEEDHRAYERLNFFSGLLEEFNPNQVMMTPEPELAFSWGQHNEGHLMLQILFDPSFHFSKGQDTSMPGSEGLVRRGNVGKDLRVAERAASEFRARVSYFSFPDSEVEYYINSDKLFEQQTLSPRYYVNAVYFRFQS